MTQLRISEVATLMRVSDDTVRRWVEQGRLTATRGAGSRQVIDGAEVAAFVRERRDQEQDAAPFPSSARNRLEGIVTEVKRDGLVAVVEIQAGPFRLVSLMTREAADELELEPGSLATAVVKSTTVVVEKSRPGDEE
ncbi:helix-turn-helix domain-containing protein [Cryobacterium sp. TMT1-21]|uniref:Helix-turn-helix domain-containing protein n=1 Tax=Cryobacterium shii TaxID=1259235 RepID=A0AAQ2C822_9MICO|nr:MULTISPECIES: TOBE domain-containing protein [Cryobacterium]TFC51308.1 helix-turn-helix domain-containing protein [Cryobacterium shii]TFC83746.1 helix-turn-helix domain-containing protein [Cryobacterium sp. TmT2-59]TFD15359.1 helix-turn-helix domain-containing protein [Cryobacterium sp. TMT1-21]TFD20574.1 helix-turn-helix domain-containing protein [Cryobacterium sp. TMT4-10]TFD20745.1 helix-turn-helix domain-containing protein [Cryobacterium sp. TMT2-23]